MKIFLTGATGFVGATLVPHLASLGHELCLLTRRGERLPFTGGNIYRVEGDSTKPGPWWNEVAKCDAAVNMAGEPIFGRWSKVKKQGIRESRLSTTRNLVDAIPGGRPFTLLSTSAVGIYGNAGERECGEDAPLGSDFLATVAKEWEGEAQRAADKGARVCLTRFGIVMGKGGGALSELVKNTQNFIGGPVGGGKQWFSWIHQDDLARALAFLLEHQEISGPVNISSPNPVRQGDSVKVLGRLLNRPSFLPAPALAIRLVLGEFADVVLFSQKMAPKKLMEAGFTWQYPDFEDAVAKILEKEPA